MEKLLHERLREAASIGESLITMENGVEIWPLTQEEENAIADEIERYYIPRPRFEDGEPVVPGSFVEQYGKPVEVVGVMPTLRGYSIIEVRGGHVIHVTDGELVRRQAPKVYDADGVEIKVGDTVWCIDDEPERKWRVEGIHADKPLIELYELDAIGDHLWGWVNAERFTHERPVFDADGVRICQGDTVWELCGDGPHFVKIPYGITGKTFFEDGFYCSPEYLTHREPDSLEKLRDDMKNVWENWTPKEMDGEWVNRLTALIESGA